MFWNITLWNVASEKNNFEIKYTNMYCFGRSCNTWTWSLSKVFYIIGMEILTTALSLKIYDTVINTIIKLSGSSIISTPPFKV